jgi:hypothetical protein
VGTCNGVTSAPPPADLICQWLTLEPPSMGCGSAPSEHPKLIVDWACGGNGHASTGGHQQRVPERPRATLK